jgi:hypothetical protein
MNLLLHEEMVRQRISDLHEAHTATTWLRPVAVAIEFAFTTRGAGS